MSLFTNPLEGIVLGDPFVLRDRGRFYLYGTNDGPPLPDGRVIPVFRSDDLIHWEPLGGALEPSEPSADHWAPEVLAWNGRYSMVVSFGDVDRNGHALWVAVADRPEGPFRLKARVSDPSERFSIDGSWLLDDDGRLYLFRCLDFVAEDDPPHGTGIVVQPMLNPWTPSGPPAPVLRAHSPWQVFETDRTMPLYGGRTFEAWYTIEGPAPVKRGGRYYCGYSGGNYGGAYGTGEAVADAPLGPYEDLRGREGPIFGTTPGLVEGPGHFSVVRPDLVHDWIVLHGRRPGEPGRRVWLCPASWGDDGVTIGALTDRPQPAPPRPTLLCRFDGPFGSMPEDWRFQEGSWRVDGDGLLQGEEFPNETYAIREGFELGSGDWAVEVSFRFPESGWDQEAGLILFPKGINPWDAEARSLDVILSLAGKSFSAGDAEGSPGKGVGVPIPSFGDEPFDPRGYHTLEVRSRAGRGEVRLDGVLHFTDRALPRSSLRLALYTWGVASFGSVCATIPDGGAAKSS
jgi:arabinan endo-1,5-alpha-L-arabinosidase